MNSFMLFLLSVVVYIITVTIISTKALHMLQQNRYNRGYRYIKWIFRHFKENFFTIHFIYFLFLLTLLTDSLHVLLPYLFIVISVFVSYVFIDGRKKESYKLPLKYTARIKRIMVTNTIVYLLPCIFMICFYDEDYLNIYYLVLGLLLQLNYFIVMLDNFINRPVEKMVGQYFLNKAKSKLNSLESMEVIGVTGSYGKTSTKNILYDILNVKYNVFKTPANYNTLFGLMITINNFLDIYNDYFIAEMGACKKGEIKELCDLVHPKYGVLTRIGLAHLETFGSEETILRTKFELIESLSYS